MKTHNIVWLVLLVLTLGACNRPSPKATVAKVELKKNEADQYRLYVDGEEFYVMGVGCEGGDVAAIAEHRGNSFRTWMDQEGQG